MAQRTLFPPIPNTSESAYVPVVASLFGELARHEEGMKFKALRGWLKERNIYSKEEVDQLFDFLGCTCRPVAKIGDFGQKFLACETPDKQQTALYLWISAWNRFLPKYIFEALDVEGGGRLHSTHELYRLITSYVYAGEYVTLPSFQAWIKWMAATGYIRYIGIRWGLGELGKAEMSAIRMLDVDELLEDEEEEREAAEAAGEASAGPAAPDISVDTGKASPPAEPASPPDGEAPQEEDLPDMPPEPPVPQWEPEEPEEEATPEEPPAKKTTKKKAAKRAAKAPASVSTDQLDAQALGLNPKEYGANPRLFLLKVAVAARLATVANGRDWLSFFTELNQNMVLTRWFVESQPLEQLLAEAGWFEGSTELLCAVVVDVMRIGSVLKADKEFVTRLEEANDVGGVVWRLHDRLYGGEITSAPFWIVKAMYAMELWDNPPV